MIFFQICYFFTKKAAFYVEDNERIRKAMRIVFYIVLVVSLGFSIY